jgi:PKD repeat protein
MTMHKTSPAMPESKQRSRWTREKEKKMNHITRTTRYIVLAVVILLSFVLTQVPAAPAHAAPATPSIETSLDAVGQESLLQNYGPPAPDAVKPPAYVKTTVTVICDPWGINDPVVHVKIEALLEAVTFTMGGKEITIEKGKSWEVDIPVEWALVMPNGEWTFPLVFTTRGGRTVYIVLSAKIECKPANQKPTCTVGADPASGDAPLTSAIKIVGKDPENQSLSYLVKYGDGTADGNAADTTHVFAAAGEYTINATVTDPAGNSGDCSTTVTVGVAPQPEVNPVIGCKVDQIRPGDFLTALTGKATTYIGNGLQNISTAIIIPLGKKTQCTSLSVQLDGKWVPLTVTGWTRAMYQNKEGKNVYAFWVSFVNATPGGQQIASGLNRIAATNNVGEPKMYNFGVSADTKPISAKEAKKP